MEEIPAPEVQKTDQPQRPVFLTVVCILTFIGSGLSFISSMVIGIFHDLFIRVMEEVAKTIDLPGMEMISQASPSFFIASAVLYLAALAGAFEMWRLHKRGFHIYTVAQILSVMAPMYFLHLSSPGIVDMILSGIFILFYGSQLKYMS